MVEGFIDTWNIETVANPDGQTEPLQEYEDVPTDHIGGLVRSPLWEESSVVKPE